MIKVIKIGGKLIEDDKVLGCLCDKLSAYYPHCVLVHGGGGMAGQLSSRLGMETKMPMKEGGSPMRRHWK